MRSKRTEKTGLRIISFLLALFVALSTSLTSYASVQKYTTVRIPCNLNDFLRVDDDGNVSGYLAEYLDELAVLNEWKYEYISCNWEEAMDFLQEGKLDFIFPTNYTEEREEVMDFADTPFGYTAAGIFALSNSNYDYENFADFDGARITFAKKSSNENDIAEFAKKNKFSYEPVYNESNEEMMDALRNGEADLAVFSAANEFPDGVLVSIMESKPVFFAVKEGNTQLLEKINNGMQNILQTDSTLVADLFHKSLVGSNRSTAAMTQEEKNFIDSGKEVVIGFYEDTEPLAYIDEDGTYKGIYIELIEKIKKYSNINIILKPINRESDWKELVKNGTIDFYVGSSKVIVSKDDEFVTTNPIIEYANILVTDNKSTFASIEKPVIALTKGRAYWADYLEKYVGSKLEIKYCKTAKDCMLAVVNGDADATLLNNHEFNYHSKNARLSSLVQWPQYRFPTSVGFAASENIDDVMFSTLNKAVGLITTDDLNTIVDKYACMPYDSYSSVDIIYNARIPLAAVAIIIFISVIILILINVFKRQKESIKNKAIERERQQFQVLAALSRNYVAVYYTDLDDDSCEALQIKNGSFANELENNSHSKTFKDYINRYIDAEYYDVLMPYCDPENIIKRFETDEDFTIRYQVNKSGVRSNFEMHFVDISANSEEHKMVFGVRCIDETIKEEQQQQKLLKDALDGANRANSAKSEFLSRMSHDIRTPMNAIIGMTAIAQANIDDKNKVSESLGKISNASNHLLGLINDILDMSKIESGKFSLAQEKIDLKELIGNLLDIMQPQIKEHNHKLKVDINDITHTLVIGDSLRIRQAFINLLGNAVKYTPDGGEISVTVKEKKVNVSSVGCYEFIFSDNGIGMSKEVLEHIFEPFIRADNSQTGKIQGTGLGLPITRNIAQMMNGNIAIQSKEGEGSTFVMTIFLDLQEENDVIDAENISAENHSGENSVKNIEQDDLTGKRVLVAEDNIINREIAREILEMTGLEIEEAENGKEAVDMFSNSAENYYDAVFMDIQMPIMNGYEATIAIRELDRPDAITVPIIAMTANAFVEDIQRAKNSGMNEHLPKPIDFKRLNDILHQYLS